MRFAVLGNPENRRVALFRAALAARGLPAAVEVAWIDLLAGRAPLDAVLAEVDVLRIESPGESFPVERELIALGADSPGAALSADAARALEEDLGRVRHSRQWFSGFGAILRRIAGALEAADVPALIAPAEITLMFDKPACHDRLRDAGVAVPRALPPVDGYQALRAAMNAAGLPRVFVKSAYGSSASGVVALATQETPGASRLMATTSAELVREGGEVRLYNSLRIRRYSREEDVASLVDTLCRDGVHVEEWVPKLSLDKEACDVRIVVIDGRAQHAVVRQSASPLTNLHLGNKRGDMGAFVERATPEGWRALCALAEQAAAQVPGALYCGVDVVLATDRKRRVVLELNAFGDLLPRVEVDGRDTYAAEVEAALARYSG